MDKEIAVLNAKLDNITHQVEEVKTDVKQLSSKVDNVKDEIADLKIVRSLVYGLVGLIVVGVFTALLSLIL